MNPEVELDMTTFLLTSPPQNHGDSDYVWDTDGTGWEKVEKEIKDLRDADTLAYFRALLIWHYSLPFSCLCQ